MIKQLRVYQWSKNFLLFVPALASHQLMVSGVFINALTGFISFSLLASGIYVLNDIVDADYDRKHPTKKDRPIASGDLSMFIAYAILLFCILSGLILSMTLGNSFFAIALAYILLNLVYSIYLKRVFILDIIILMSFYTLRLIAGHLPDAIPLSPWLLSFFIFLFFSLGLLKRYVDIIIMKDNITVSLTETPYNIGDGNMIISLGVSSGLVSTLVLILYTGSEQVQLFYATPILLIALSPVMLYWISRMWFMASRGTSKSDPVLFAIKDMHFYFVVLCFLSIMFLSKYLVL
jgi:4-hydroxybenzoate polyprenyltransferase